MRLLWARRRAEREVHTRSRLILRAARSAPWDPLDQCEISERHSHRRFGRGPSRGGERTRRSPREEAQDITHKTRDEQVQWVFEILFGQGTLDKEEAVRRVHTALVDLGLAAAVAEEPRSAVRVAIERALDAGIKQGRFDRPKRGQVRAIRTDPKEYSLDDWTLVLRARSIRVPDSARRRATLRRVLGRDEHGALIRSPARGRRDP